ncbi:hypothetical protein [Halobellus sp. GM3]|uniref:hypothetical protein n=1 Tax=Halobellus sp. GM3 TaxID=3458410 RepID=UPI00403DAAEE
MNPAGVVRQLYRVYGLGILVWAGWSAAWMGFGIDVSPTAIGTGWLAIAGIGAMLAIAMGILRFSDEYRLFKTQSNRERIRHFQNHFLSSTPLHLYVIALAAWSFLTVEWWAINLDLVSRTIVAYGWFLIALYGLGLTISLTVKHEEAVVKELDEVTPESIDLEAVR